MGGIDSGPLENLNMPGLRIDLYFAGVEVPQVIATPSAATATTTTVEGREGGVDGAEEARGAQMRRHVAARVVGIEQHAVECAGGPGGDVPFRVVHHDADGATLRPPARRRGSTRLRRRRRRRWWWWWLCGRGGRRSPLEAQPVGALGRIVGFGTDAYDDEEAGGIASSWAPWGGLGATAHAALVGAFLRGFCKNCRGGCGFG